MVMDMVSCGNRDDRCVSYIVLDSTFRIRFSSRSLPSGIANANAVEERLTPDIEMLVRGIVAGWNARTTRGDWFTLAEWTMRVFPLLCGEERWVGVQFDRLRERRDDRA